MSPLGPFALPRHLDLGIWRLQAKTALLTEPVLNLHFLEGDLCSCADTSWMAESNAAGVPTASWLHGFMASALELCCSCHRTAGHLTITLAGSQLVGAVVGLGLLLHVPGRLTTNSTTWKVAEMRPASTSLALFPEELLAHQVAQGHWAHGHTLGRRARQQTFHTLESIN